MRKLIDSFEAVVKNDDVQTIFVLLPFPSPTLRDRAAKERERRARREPTRAHNVKH